MKISDKQHGRIERIAEQIQRELAELLRLEVKDPRVRMITITGVEVSRDYSHAKIFYTTMGSGLAESGASPDNTAVQNGLEHASGFLRSQLAHIMKLRVTPQLHFVYDSSVSRGAHLSQLIDQAVASDQALSRK